jgi:hypothetical protein
MTATVRPRTSHRSGIRIAIGLVVAALIVAALLVSAVHSSGSSKPSKPVLGPGSAPAPAASATVSDDSGCRTYGAHIHVC